MNLPIQTPGIPDLCMRPWTPEDLDDLLRYADNPKIAANLTDAFPSPYTKEAGLAFIARVSAQQPNQILAVSLSGRAIGSAGVHVKEDISRLNAELGYFLGEPYWGRGIMSGVVKTMIRYGFDTFPIERIYARPFPFNIASQRILEKAGMKLEAVIPNSLIKNGVVMDERIYAIRRSDMKER